MQLAVVVSWCLLGCCFLRIAAAWKGRDGSPGSAIHCSSAPHTPHDYGLPLLTDDITETRHT